MLPAQAVAGKVAVSLLAPTAFTFAADLVGEYEGGGQGLHWGNLWADPYPLGAVLLMLALDAKLYALLAWCALLHASSFDSSWTAYTGDALCFAGNACTCRKGCACQSQSQ